MKDKTVLVCEDHEISRKLFTELLSLLGCRHVVATNGKDALELAREHRPHLIALDIGLPEMSGTEVVKALCADPELMHTPVIAVTAHAMRGDEAQFLAMGFDAYVSKPISVTHFLETVTSFLTGASAIATVSVTS